MRYRYRAPHRYKYIHIYSYRDNYSYICLPACLPSCGCNSKFLFIAYFVDLFCAAARATTSTVANITHTPRMPRTASAWPAWRIHFKLHHVAPRPRARYLCAFEQFSNNKNRCQGTDAARMNDRGRGGGAKHGRSRLW